MYLGSGKSPINRKIVIHTARDALKKNIYILKDKPCFKFQTNLVLFLYNIYLTKQHWYIALSGTHVFFISND